MRNLNIKLVVIFLIALALRLYFILTNSISFHFDMSRDAFIIEQIWKNLDLKIVGPPTSTSGLFHGVLYYYLLAPFYYLFSGNPEGPAIFIATVNSLTILPIYLLAKRIFNNKLALLSSFLFAISFESVQYGTWISNPSPAVLMVAVYFYGLHLWWRSKKSGLLLASFFAGLATQFQFFLVYLFPLIIFFKIVFKPKIDLKMIILALGLAIITLSTFLVSYFKFHSSGSNFSWEVFLINLDHYYFKFGFTDSLLNYINKLADVFINNLYPANVFLGGLIGIASIFTVRDNPFLLFAIFSSILMYLFGGHSSNYANIGIIVPAILAFVNLFKKLIYIRRSLAFILITLIIISNLFAVFKITPNGQLALVIPKDMYLRNELKLIDRSYQIADGQPFSINTLTLPLWTNTTWAYLYHYYGQKRYGYLPSFYGHDQVGLLGERTLIYDQKPKNITFFIIEPLNGIPQDIAVLEVGSENAKTVLKNEENFGSLKLQIREPKKDEKN